MDTTDRGQVLFSEQRDRINATTDRMFAILMAFQWIAGILAAVFVSPRTWAGAVPSIHVHVWSALIGGGILSGLPIYLALRHSGEPITRYTIAVAQMLWSALLVHLTGGRIETHFHVFGSMAFIAIYRDCRLLIPATIVTVLDHGLRGIFWPQSVYGVLSASPFRTLEHAAWVVFENIVLVSSCRRSTAEMWEIARQRAELENTNDRIESQVRERTDQLRQSLQWKAVVLDTAADGIITIDNDGAILEFNRAAECIFGFSKPEVVGQNVSMLLPKQEPARDDRPALSRLLGDDLAKSRTRHEFEGLRKDGSNFPLDLSVSKSELGGNVTFTAIVRDLTEEKAAEAEIAQVNADLQVASRWAGMAEIATGVLHNIGNVLNSVNVAASVVTSKLRASRVSGLTRAASMLKEHENDLVEFLSEDGKGRKIPPYLSELAQHLESEQSDILSELTSLTENINHIKNIVNMQQSYATRASAIESVSVNSIVDEALRFSESSFSRSEIRIQKENHSSTTIETDQHRIVQILINLIRNGRQAMSHLVGASAVVLIQIEETETTVRIHVKDRGIGIPKENLTAIFRHGFTTKKKGHGFGLHHSANTAKELGGLLTVQSDGPNQGATFTLELPKMLEEVQVS